jgi:hypothetical protein
VISKAPLVAGDVEIKPKNNANRRTTKPRTAPATKNENARKRNKKIHATFLTFRQTAAGGDLEAALRESRTDMLEWDSI